MATNTPNNNPSGFVKAPIKLFSDPKLTVSSKLVWLAIKYRQGQNPDAWPSQEMLVGDCGSTFSSRTVKRAIKQLKNKGWLKVSRPSKRETNHYIPIVPTSDNLSPVTSDNLSPVTSDKNDIRQVTKSTPKLDKENKIKCPTSDEARLSGLLLTLILDRKPNFREGQPICRKQTIERWAVHVGHLIRLDKRAPEQIEAVIRWCQQDDFWRNNILSTEKLRKQIDRLELKMQEQSGQITTAPLQRDADGRTPLEVALEVERIQKNG